MCFPRLLDSALVCYRNVANLDDQMATCMQRQNCEATVCQGTLRSDRPLRYALSISGLAGSSYFRYKNRAQ